jgi:hypothetical protein
VEENSITRVSRGLQFSTLLNNLFSKFFLLFHDFLVWQNIIVFFYWGFYGVRIVLGIGDGWRSNSRCLWVILQTQNLAILTDWISKQNKTIEFWFWKVNRVANSHLVFYSAIYCPIFFQLVLIGPCSFAKYFFPAKFFFCILEKEILAGKNLLCKGGFYVHV